MGVVTIEAVGLKCPQPVLKLAIAARTTPKGERVVVKADCSSFPEDVKKWCEKEGRTLLSLQESGGSFRAEILM